MSLSDRLVREPSGTPSQEPSFDSMLVNTKSYSLAMITNTRVVLTGGAGAEMGYR